MEPILPPIRQEDPDLIISHDAAGPGGAAHSYKIAVMGQPKAAVDEGGVPYIKRVPVAHVAIDFQKGGKQTEGANGITQEALLEIVRHRLASFQQGPFACKENASALAHVEDAIRWLHRRTAKRQRRGVEGREVK